MGLSYDMVVLLVGGVGEGNSGEVSVGGDQRMLLGSVEPGRVNITGQIGHEYSVARDVEGDADSFHQIRDHDFLRHGFAGRRIEPGATYRVAAGWIATVGPVQHVVLQIEFEVDGFGQVVEKHLDVAAVGGRLAFRQFDVCAEDAADS